MSVHQQPNSLPNSSEIVNNQRSPSSSESDSDVDDFDDEGLNSSAVSRYLMLLLILK